MDLQPIKIMKQDERGTIYYCGESNFIARREGTISADHKHDDDETFYLVYGKIEITVADETKVIEAPMSIYITPNVYHKIIALTDFGMVFQRESEKQIEASLN